MPRFRHVLLLTLLSGVGAVDAVSAATPAQIGRAHRQEAIAAADQLLGQVVLPAGATKVRAEPPGDAHQLGRTIELFPFAAEVDRHAFLITTASPSAVIASVQAHLPTGAKFSGSGLGGSGAFASYSLPALTTPTLGVRDLEVNAVVRSDGSTAVRADAVVRYVAPRLAAQKIPSRARALQITMANYRSEPLLTVTVTRRLKVRRIAALIDSLPLEAALTGVAISCPALRIAPTDTFSFLDSAGHVLATLREPANTPSSPDPCVVTALTIRPHGTLALLGGGTLLRQAGAVLGLALTRRP